MKRKIWISFLICIAFAMMFLSACRNSVEVDNDEPTTSMQSSEALKGKSSSSVKSSSQVKSSSSKKSYPDSFKPDDKEYPYANIPRIVIYTENRQKIKDRETEIPAKLQIWGKEEAESEIVDLTIRGRGNSSWLYMPKKSYKIEFVKKQSMLGMPKDKDWALISNYADKTLMKNYLMYNLSAKLGAFYSPRCEFAELYLNGEYLGVYLLTETIKIGKNRVDIPENDDSYLVEIDGKYKKNEQVVFSDIITTSLGKNSFRIHEPKNASENVLLKIEDHIKSLETFIKKIEPNSDNKVEQWINIDDYLKFYWVQEFSKNPDAAFSTSVYFVWEKNKPIRMGPVWDFDISFGGHNDTTYIHPEEWYLRDVQWNAYLFKDSVLKQARLDFWNKNKNEFNQVINEADSVYTLLKPAAKNNFKKWDILQSQELIYHHYAYSSYKEAVTDLKNWMKKRIQWIEH